MKPNQRISMLYLPALTLALLLSVASHAASKIDHLQPAFWWTGMADDTLQIMVHGEDIAKTSPALDYPGVTLLATERLENPNYLFLKLKLASDTKPGTFDIRFDVADETVANYHYELKARRKGSAQRQGFSAKDVIYLITPDRFANGDESNDAVAHLKEGKNRDYKGGRHGGDLQGIINHLDYLQKMGFTQIWMMPVLVNDMEKYSYHGYSTTDYYTVDSRLGSNALYRTLSLEARKRGMGLIKDMIPNHIGLNHWWMEDLPSKDWINHEGKFVSTTHTREALHDPHGVEDDIRAFSDGWFVPTMPDLNQGNPLLATYLIQNAIWWVEYADLTGIRVDTYSYSDMAFLSQWTKRLMTEYPNLNIVGEEWTVNPAITAFWQRGTNRHSDYDSSLPSVMDFPLQAKVISGLKNQETWGTGVKEIYDTIASDFLYGDPYNLVVFPDNHDMSRIASQLNDDVSLIKMAMSYFMTTRGIPQIFYGTEILMNNPGTDDHGIIRADFPGGWPGDNVNGFTGKGLTEKQADFQQFLAKLLNWRKTNPAITQGKLTHYSPKDGVYSYFRHHKQNLVFVILNKNEKAMTLDLARFKAMLKDKKQATDVISGNAFPLGDTLKVPHKTALILELD